jgi:hypothetical protein
MSLPELIIEHAPLHPGSPQGMLAILLCIVYLAIFAATPGAWRRPTFWLPLVWFLLTCQRIRHAPLFAIVAGIALADLLPRSRLAAWLVRRHWLREPSPFLLRKPSPFGRGQGEGASLHGNPPSPQPSPEDKGSVWKSAPVRIAVIVLVMMAPLFAATIWLHHIGPLPLLGARWARPTPRVWPEDLIEPLTSYAAEHRDRAPVFNEPILGGFLIDNFPTLRVFIDGRCELYGEPFLQEFVNAWREPSRVGKWQQEFGFRAALIEAASPLRRYFDNSEKWQLVAEAPAARFYRMEKESP